MPNIQKQLNLLVPKKEQLIREGKFEEALNNNNVEEATKLFSHATKKIDQACTKGIIVKNTAARKKSSLAKKLNAAKA